MKILKRRPRLLILLTLAVVAAVTVTVVMVIQANKMETLSPREERDRAASGAVVPSGQVDCRKVESIALTFDGNQGEPTDRLMDLLKEYKAPSTFFLEGRRVHVPGCGAADRQGRPRDRGPHLDARGADRCL